MTDTPTVLGSRPATAASRNNVMVQGRPDGPTLLFAHGFGCDQGMWSHVLPAFLPDYRVVLFDHVGAGGSDVSVYDPDTYSSITGYAQDVLEICDELGLTEVVMVGHSVSAMIALEAAVARPDLFSRLVLVAPNPRYVDDPATDYVGGLTRDDVDGLLRSLDSNYFAWAASLAPMVMRNPEQPQLADGLAASFCRTDPTIAKQFARVTFLADSRPLLGEVRTPSLILQCTDDLLAPPEVGAYLQSRLAGSTLVQLEATGHCPHISAPAETTRAIHEYLASR